MKNMVCEKTETEERTEAPCFSGLPLLYGGHSAANYSLSLTAVHAQQDLIPCSSATSTLILEVPVNYGLMFRVLRKDLTLNLSVCSGHLCLRILVSYSADANSDDWRLYVTFTKLIILMDSAQPLDIKTVSENWA